VAGSRKYLALFFKCQTTPDNNTEAWMHRSWKSGGSLGFGLNSFEGDT